MTYKNFTKWKRKPAKGGQISPFMGDYVLSACGYLPKFTYGGPVKFQHADWVELPDDSPYTPGWIIKMPKIKPMILDFKTAPGPEDLVMDVMTYTVITPPHEMKVVSLTVTGVDYGKIPCVQLIAPNGLGPYYLDFKAVRGMWIKPGDYEEISTFHTATLTTQGPMTVWWLCNGSACCGGDDKCVDHKLTGKPPIKSVSHPPLLAVDKKPYDNGLLMGTNWAVPESAEAKKERLLKESDEEVRRLAQQILEDASDVLLVDGWIKGSYHRTNNKKGSISGS